MDNSFISIIIPTYNRAHIIGKTLDSIINQSYTNWECIIVDDGSTDNTANVMAAYIKKDDRFIYLNRPKNRQKGPCSCRNYGFEMSKGSFINFFDSDDLLKPWAFELWLNTFAVDADAVISKIELVDFNTFAVKKEYEIYSDDLIQDYFLGRINFWPCGPLWRKNFLEKQNFLFNESIRNGDDLDFNLRMLYKKPKLIFLENSLIQIRIHANSLSKERNKLNKNELNSYLNTLDVHLNEVKKYSTVNKSLVNNYVISRYTTYLLSSLIHRNKIHFFLFRRVFKRLITLGYYKQLLKLNIGYLSYLLFNRGYFLIKYKY